MKRIVLLIFVFLMFYVLDLTTYVFDGLKGWAFILKSSVYNFKGVVERLPKCLTETSGGRREVPHGSVIGVWDGNVVVKALGKVGDVVVGRNGVFVGFVYLPLKSTILVETVLNTRLAMNVEVVREGGIGIEGFLKGGYPPLVEVPEGIDVIGWGVYVSKSEDFGYFLRSMGMGYIGKIVGKEGDLFVLDPTDFPKEVVVFGR